MIVQESLKTESCLFRMEANDKLKGLSQKISLAGASNQAVVPSAPIGVPNQPKPGYPVQPNYPKPALPYPNQQPVQPSLTNQNMPPNQGRPGVPNIPYNQPRPVLPNSNPTVVVLPNSPIRPVYRSSFNNYASGSYYGYNYRPARYHNIVGELCTNNNNYDGIVYEKFYCPIEGVLWNLNEFS